MSPLASALRPLALYKPVLLSYKPRFHRAMSSATSPAAAATCLASHKKIVVCTDLGPALSLLAGVETVVWPHAATQECPREWLLQNVVGASGLVVCFKDMVDKEVVDAAGPELEAVTTISVGYEHIDLPLLAARNIQLGYTPDVLTDAVADSTVMLALMASRRTNLTSALVTTNQWPSFQWTPFAFTSPQLSRVPFGHSPTVGFLGFGRIAQAVLRRLSLGFGVADAIYASRPGSPPREARDSAILQSLAPNLVRLRPVPLPELARDSDFLFILAPGGPETHHIVDTAFFARMKRTAVLVNNGRGSVVSSHALAAALREDRLWGAGLDVVDEEPHVGPDHPLLLPGVREKCVVVPHLGSATVETRAEMARMTARNVLLGVEGQRMETAVDLSGFRLLEAK
ncbi:Glyoxylate reductase [Mycena indigotica]|uniref:Glyoxylate reductase n=1 Tax=Mycena indigotica TaxID=2126181 RepID=A0A8H6WCT5_9AGAR|nr:Glyoxylate reductase [Mycena indigotica]KAF7311761.1 Glyoxylate reductase [Mycena indigotica]